MTVPPGMVGPGSAIRLWMHYDGPTSVLTQPGYQKQAQITYTNVASSIVSPVDQQYVALSCDTDGAVAANFRFGFNGQQKDDEVAGKGNHNTALFWEYDTRLGRSWNLDPVDQVSVNNYAAFGLNPIYNKDPLGNVIAPWWLPSSSGDKIPGYGGGVSSPYKSFISGADLNGFTKTAVSLYNSNSIFKKTVDMLQASKSVYHVQQRYETDASGLNASYSDATNTVSFKYFEISKSELFEEVFHAGQDDYYTAPGMSRSNLADEVEAKAANILSGFSDASVKSNRDYGAITDYFKTGKKGKGFDAALDNLITDTYDTYKGAKGEEWAKKNAPSNVDKGTVLKYLVEHNRYKVRQKTIAMSELKCWRLLYAGVFLILVASINACHSSNRKPEEPKQAHQKPPPPPFSREDQIVYDSIRNQGYAILQKGKIILFYRDTITDNTRRLRLARLLRQEFGMEYRQVYDIDYGLSRSFQVYVQPIMDSVIAAKYGHSGKDSIIAVLNELLERESKR